MPEPTGADLHEEPDAIVQLLAQGGLNANEETQRLAQAELDYRASVLERLRVRPLTAVPDPVDTDDPLVKVAELRELGAVLKVAVDDFNRRVEEVRRDVVAFGRVLVRAERLHEEDGA